jgi:hypothetical protein
MDEVERSRLGELAAEINAEHRAFEGAFRKTLEHGIRAGELLAEAKAACEHGAWLPWLAENFEGAHRTAQEYMRLYNYRDEIRANTRDSAHLSMGEALREIAAPRDGIPRRERAMLEAAQEAWDDGEAVHVPLWDGLARLDSQARRGFVAESAWSMLILRVRQYRAARAPLEDGSSADLSPAQLTRVLRGIESAKSTLSEWVEECEWIESQVRACDWPPGRGMPSAAFDGKHKHLPLTELYDDGDEDGFPSPRGFVRELCGRVV